MARLSNILGPSGLATKDGDILDVGFTPANYTPDASPAEAQDADDLAAHLKGLDTEIGSLNTALANVGGGAWEFITETEITSNVVGVDFSQFDYAKWDVYAFVLEGVSISNNNDFSIRFSYGGGDFDATSDNYEWALLTVDSRNTSAATSASDEMGTEIRLGGTYYNTQTSGTLMVFHAINSNPTQTTFFGLDDRGGLRMSAGEFNPYVAVDAIRFLTPSGNVVAGKITMYGVKKS